jgi:hypothetical protein
MEKSEFSELRINVRLLEGNQEIATLEKCFGFVEMQNGQESSEATTKTISEMMSSFQKEIESRALERGRKVRVDLLRQAMYSTILFIVSRAESDLTIDIPVEKAKEEKKDDNTNSDT